MTTTQNPTPLCGMNKDAEPNTNIITPPVTESSLPITEPNLITSTGDEIVTTGNLLIGDQADQGTLNGDQGPITSTGNDVVTTGNPLIGDLTN